MRFILYLLLLSCLAMQSQSSSWNCAEDCLIKWDTNCAWNWSPSEAIASAAVPSEQCGAFCLGTIDCKAFDWFQGTCFAYSATTGILSNVGWMCGYREFLEKEAQN